MKLALEITCDNAAFENFAGLEVARILGELATTIGAEDGRGAVFSIGDEWLLRDVNGNQVGRARVFEH